jgi:hypothetical protein
MEAKESSDKPPSELTPPPPLNLRSGEKTGRLSERYSGLYRTSKSTSTPNGGAISSIICT